MTAAVSPRWLGGVIIVLWARVGHRCNHEKKRYEVWNYG
jgi:hypothetical protein